MLNIEIIGFNGDNLILEVNGHSNNGRSSLWANEEVHWKVRPGCKVDSIQAIAMKNIGGNDNIFRTHEPAPQNPQKTFWKAKANTNAEEGEAYVYNIIWKKEGEDQLRTYDPILTIKPIKVVPEETSYFTTTTLIAAFAIIVALILAVMLYRSHKEIKELKQLNKITVPVK